jgi:hypothetical protein
MAKQVSLKIPELLFVAGTRGVLGAGVGLLLAGKLNRRQRNKAGWLLLTIGALTTVPIIVNIIKRAKHSMEIAA